LLGQVGFSQFKENVSRRTSAFEIGCQRANNNGVDAATIEYIVLDDNMRMAITWFGT